MIVRFKSNLLVVTAESEDERESLVCWSGDLDGYAFILKLQDPQTFCLMAAGFEAEVRREPINVTSRSLDPAIQWISKFAHTPFELDARPGDTPRVRSGQKVCVPVGPPKDSKGTHPRGRPIQRNPLSAKDSFDR